MDDKGGQNQETLVIIEEKISNENGEIVIKKYASGKPIGKSEFGQCFEVTNLENKQILAAKIVAKRTLTKGSNRRRLIDEIKIHKQLHHEGILKFEHAFEDQQNIYILTELCTNETLSDLLKRRKRLTRIEVQSYTIQILNALKYLHQQRVIHRNLKLSNLMLNENMELRLGGFEFATKLESEGERKWTICGSSIYIAPEILEGKFGYSYEVDIWSLGVIIYTLLIGKHPFQAPDIKTAYAMIKMNDCFFPENIALSDPTKNLITKLLNQDPSRRPTFDQILSHPFMSSSYEIPKVFPPSTLACPPTQEWIDMHKKQIPHSQTQSQNILSQNPEFQFLENHSQVNSEEREVVDRK